MGIQYESLRGRGGFFQKSPASFPCTCVPYDVPPAPAPCDAGERTISNASCCGGEDHLKRLGIAGERTISSAEVPLPRSPLSLAVEVTARHFAFSIKKHREGGIKTTGSAGANGFFGRGGQSEV